MVDSFRTVVRKAGGGTGEVELQGFIQRLALHLTSWQATTFLIGEYAEGEIRDNPVFTVADGLFWLYQQVERNSIVRKLQVMKLRGQASVPGLHTFRITADGVQAFPRTFGLTGRTKKARDRRRLSCGVAELDAMLGGGIPEGDSLLVAGPSGAGKSVFAAQFIAEGLRRGEPGIVAIFEERPEEYTGRAANLGMDFETPQHDGKLDHHLPPAPRPVGRRDDARDPRRGGEDGREAGGDRLAGRVRDGAGPRLPRRLPRVALPDDRGVDADRRHDREHRRGDRDLHRARR